MAKRWLIKDLRGLHSGPHVTSEITEMIKLGRLTGSERISEHPGGAWMLISKHPKFFEIFLSAVDDSLIADDESVVTDIETIENVEKKSLSQKKQLSPADQSKSRQSSNEESETSKSETGRSQTPALVHQGNNSRLQREYVTDTTQVIELTSIAELEKAEQKNRIKNPLRFLLAGIAVLLAFYYFSNVSSAEGIHLLRPSWDGKALDGQRAKDLFQKAVASFSLDTYSEYMQAQNTLVQIVEGQPGYSDAYEILCATYKELWPFVSQDRKDIETLKRVTKKITESNPSSRGAEVCKLTQSFLLGDYKAASVQALGSLRVRPDLIFANQIMGELEYARKDYRTSKYYFNQAYDLWTWGKKWLKPKVHEAKALSNYTGADSGRASAEASKIYQSVLQMNPRHKVAMIEYGELEFFVYRHTAKAEETLKIALALDEKIERSIEADGYYALARIAKTKNDQRRSIEYAEKAFSMNPGHSLARQLLMELGAHDQIKRAKAGNQSKDLVFMGDQYKKSGNCFAAQAEYKAAFEVDRKNGLAALRAGQCLWELNQSSEAIEWLKKSIMADDTNIEAYVLLADDYSLLYDYAAAAQVLQKGLNKYPNSYELLRGFAMIEMRRQSFQAAIAFGDRALQLYETDIDTILLLASAYLGLEDYSKSFSYCARAIEMDPTNVRAQVLYAKVLAGLRGTSTAINYLKDMVNNYPRVVEYRLAYGEIMAKDEKLVEAESMYRQTLQLDPKNKGAYIALGRLYQTQKRFTEAQEMYLTAASFDPTDVQPLFLAGQLYYDAGKYEEALQKFERVKKGNKYFPLVSYYIGRCYFKLKEYDKAHKAAEEEKTFNPGLAEPYLLAADIFIEEGQYSNCAGQIQKAIEKGARTSDNFVLIARCYRQSGALDIALSMLEQASILESGNPDIYREQGAIYHLQGSLEKAQEAYGKYLALAPNSPDRLFIENKIREIENTNMENR